MKRPDITIEDLCISFDDTGLSPKRAESISRKLADLVQAFLDEHHWEAVGSMTVGSLQMPPLPVDLDGMNDDEIARRGAKAVTASLLKAIEW